MSLKSVSTSEDVIVDYGSHSLSGIRLLHPKPSHKSNLVLEHQKLVDLTSVTQFLVQSCRTLVSTARSALGSALCYGPIRRTLKEMVSQIWARVSVWWSSNDLNAIQSTVLSTKQLCNSVRSELARQRLSGQWPNIEEGCVVGFLERVVGSIGDSGAGSNLKLVWQKFKFFQ